MEPERREQVWNLSLPFLCPQSPSLCLVEADVEMIGRLSQIIITSSKQRRGREKPAKSIGEMAFRGALNLVSGCPGAGKILTQKPKLPYINDDDEGHILTYRYRAGVNRQR